MSNLAGVQINKGAIGANALNNNDAISGIIIESPAASGLALDTPVAVTNMKEVEALGIDAAHDASNYVNCHRHLSEFYRNGNEGVKLWLMLTAQDTTAVKIVEDTVALSNDAPAKQLLIASGGEIKQIGVCINPTTTPAPPAQLNGINADVYAAIPKAQAFYNWAYENFMPCQIVLEGRDYSGNATAAQDLRDGLAAPKVSIVIGQDYAYADSLPTQDGGSNPIYLQNFADLGSVLGTLSACDINQNIGDNEAFNITDNAKKIWQVPGLSNHGTNKSQFGDLQTLEDKGYIFGLEYQGMEGVRWNNDHTCIEVIVDANGNINEHTIAYGRTNDKAVRELRKAYLPKVKTKQPVDPATGKLPAGVVKYFDGIGNTVLGDMAVATEITAGEVTTDPDSDLLVAKQLLISYRIVPYGNVGEIIGTINLKTSLN